MSSPWSRVRGPPEVPSSGHPRKSPPAGGRQASEPLRRADRNASGSARLRRSTVTVTGTPHTVARAGGSRTIRTSPFEVVLTSQVPRHPCAPIPPIRSWSRSAATTDSRGAVELERPPEPHLEHVVVEDGVPTALRDGEDTHQEAHGRGSPREREPHAPSLRAAPSLPRDRGSGWQGGRSDPPTLGGLVRTLPLWAALAAVALALPVSARAAGRRARPRRPVRPPSKRARTAGRRGSSR